MAWLSRNDFTASDTLNFDDLNNLANDIRNWGQDVNAGGYALNNVLLPGWLNDPTTTVGDLIVRGPTALQRLPSAGTDGLTLVSDHTQTFGVKWGVLPAQTVPGGADTQVQYNDNGVLTGDPGLIWNYSQKYLRVSQNTGTPPPPPTGTMVAVTSADNVNNYFLISAYGLCSPNYLSRRARGSAVNPQPLVTGDTMGAITFTGFAPGGFRSNSASQMYANAESNWTDTDNGSSLIWRTTPIGSILETDQMKLSPAGVLYLAGAAPGGSGFTDDATGALLQVKGGISSNGFLTISGGRKIIAGTGISITGNAQSNLTTDLTVTNAGVVTFNGRSGTVTLQASDISGAGGLADPTSVAGDLLVRGYVTGVSGATSLQRLPVGTGANYVLTADATQSAGVKWAAPVVPLTPPGGTDTEVQFNQNGAFGGSSNFLWNYAGNFLRLSQNTATPPAPPANTLLQMSGADNANNFCILSSYGTGQANYTVRRARNTAAAPAALQSNDFIGALGFQGYGSTGFGPTVAQIAAFASENYVDTKQSTALVFQTTPLGTVGLIERMRLDNAGHLLVGIAATDGTGAMLEVAGNVSANGVLLVPSTTSVIAGPGLSGGGALSGNITLQQQASSTVQFANYYYNGAITGTRSGVNFIPGANVGITMVDDQANDRVNVTIKALAQSLTATVGGADTQVQYNYQDNIAGDGNFTWDYNNEVLTIGSSVHAPTLALNGAGQTASVLMQSDGPGNSIIQTKSFSAANPLTGMQLDSYAGRGSAATPAALAANDYLALYSYYGYNGSAWVKSNFIGVQAAAAWTTSANRAAIVFGTAPSGAGAAVESMRLSGLGHLLIGTATDDGTHAVQVSGSIKINTPLTNGIIFADGTTQTTAVSSTGMQDPTTALGDLIVRGAAAPPTKLPLGASNGMVLTVNNAASNGLGMNWAFPYWQPGTGGAIYYNGGPVGIGTANPGGNLDILNAVGSGAVVLESYAGQSNYIGRRFDGTQAAPVALGAGEAIAQFVAQGYDSSAVSGRQASILFYSDAAWTTTSHSTNTIFETTAQGSTTPTERMRITSAGLVGIATTNPLAPLEVVGSAGVPSISSWAGTILGIQTAPGANGQIMSHGSQNAAPWGMWIQVSNLSGTAFPLLLNPLGGNVGINTSSPSDHLSVYLNDNVNKGLSVINVANAGGSNTTCFIHSDQTYSGTYTGSVLDVTTWGPSSQAGFVARFGISTAALGNATWGMVITDTNLVGIGTPSPGVTLHVVGPANAASAQFTDNTYSTYQIIHANSPITNALIHRSLGTANQVFQVGSTNINALTITGAGNVGVNTLSPASPFEVHVGTNMNFGVENGSNYTSIYAVNDAANGYVPMQYLASAHYLMNGFVGIATNSPAYPLDIYGGSTFPLRISGGTGTSNSSMIKYRGIAAAADLWAVGTDYTGNGSKDFAFYSYGFGEAFNIGYANGFIGINNGAPGAQIHAMNTTNYAPSLTYGSAAAYIFNNAGVDLAMGTDSVGPYAFWLQARLSNSTAEAMVLQPLGGRLGIGMRNPAAPVHIYDGTVGYQNPSLTPQALSHFLYTSGGATELSFVCSSSYGYGWTIQVRNSGTAGYSYPIVLQPLQGNVGIGKNPGSTLDVNGSINCTGYLLNGAPFTGGASYPGVTSPGSGKLAYTVGSSVVTIGQAAATSDTISGVAAGDAIFNIAAGTNGWIFGSSGGVVSQLTLTGRWALGYTSVVVPGYLLTLAADSTSKPTTNTWNTGSDIRLKRNIRPFTEGLETILKINPIRFEYNGRMRYPEGQQCVGIDAGAHKDILPDCVSTFKQQLDDDGPMEDIFSFNPHAILFMMINAFAELAKRIEKLETLLVH